jgi:hypothetical protein
MLQPEMEVRIDLSRLLTCLLKVDWPYKHQQYLLSNTNKLLVICNIHHSFSPLLLI